MLTAAIGMIARTETALAHDAAVHGAKKQHICNRIARRKSNPYDKFLFTHYVYASCDIEASYPEVKPLNKGSMHDQSYGSRKPLRGKTHFSKRILCRPHVFQFRRQAHQSIVEDDTAKTATVISLVDTSSNLKWDLACMLLQ